MKNEIETLIKYYEKLICKKKGQISQLKFEVEYYSQNLDNLKSRLKDC